MASHPSLLSGPRRPRHRSQPHEREASTDLSTDVVDPEEASWIGCHRDLGDKEHQKGQLKRWHRGLV